MILDVINVGLSVSAILSGAAAFILGLYLVEWAKGTDSARRTPFLNLIIVLTIPSLIIGIAALWLVSTNFSDVTVDTYLTVSIIASMIPPSVFLILIALKR